LVSPTVLPCHPALGYAPAARPPVDTSGFSTPASVRRAIGPAHTPQCPQSPGRPRPPLPYWICSSRRQTPECLCDTPCRTARRTGSPAIPSLWHAAPSATSERFGEVLDSSSISLSFVASCALLQPRSLPSTGVTRLHRYYEPLRHPSRPRPSLAGVGLKTPVFTNWGFPCCVVLLWSKTKLQLHIQACCRQYPGGTAGDLSLCRFSTRRRHQQLRPSPKSKRIGSPHCLFRGLLSVHIRYGLPVRQIT
jgi:hypothetical protein